MKPSLTKDERIVVYEIYTALTKSKTPIPQGHMNIIDGIIERTNEAAQSDPEFTPDHLMSIKHVVTQTLNNIPTHERGDFPLLSSIKQKVSKFVK